MKLIRLIVATLLAAATTFFYAAWARTESDAQISRMQLDSYNTPGADSPVPPQVFAAGMSVLTALWFVLARILRVPTFERTVALLFGVVGGIAALFVLSTDEG